MTKKILLEKGDIFKYTSVSDYLTHWYTVNHRNHPEFQYRSLAKWMHCRSTSELFRIFSRRKLPSFKMVHRLIKVIGFSTDEANYFMLLTNLSHIRMKKKDKEVYLNRYKSLMKKTLRKKR